MTTSEQVFLVLCQELSFRRAAEKCYMSQQGLSEHIKRLETQYGVPLFQRRPKVALTQAGQSLRRTLEREAVLEQDLSREMENLRDGTRGKVTIGIGISRARIYLPRILELFWKEAPGVEVIVRMDNSAQLEEELAAGRLDCYIGIEAVCGENQVRRPLRVESICLAVPSRLLPEEYRQNATIRPEDLARFSKLPFVRNSPGSILNAKVDALLSSNLKLNNIADVSDYEIQLDFCRRGWAAAFLPQIVLESFGEDHLKQAGLTVFEIEGLQKAMEVDLVWDESRIYPACVQKLLDCMQKVEWGNAPDREYARQMIV